MSLCVLLLGVDATRQNAAAFSGGVLAIALPVASYALLGCAAIVALSRGLFQPPGVFVTWLFAMAWALVGANALILGGSVALSAAFAAEAVVVYYALGKRSFGRRLSRWLGWRDRPASPQPSPASARRSR